MTDDWPEVRNAVTGRGAPFPASENAIHRALADLGKQVPVSRTVAIAPELPAPGRAGGPLLRSPVVSVRERHSVLAQETNPHECPSLSRFPAIVWRDSVHPSSAEIRRCQFCLARPKAVTRYLVWEPVLPPSKIKDFHFRFCSEDICGFLMPQWLERRLFSFHLFYFAVFRLMRIRDAPSENRRVWIRSGADLCPWSRRLFR